MVRLRLGPGIRLLPQVQRDRGEQGLVAGADAARAVDQDLAFAVDHAVRTQPPFDQRDRVRGAAFERDDVADRVLEITDHQRRTLQARAAVAAADGLAVEHQPLALLLDDVEQAHGVGAS